MVADGCPRFHAGCRMVVMVAGLMVAGWLPTPLGNHAECHALGANRTRRDSPNDANDPGCVKTQNKITCAPQKNRTRSPGEFVMCPRTLTHINVAPEPCRKLFHTWGNSGLRATLRLGESALQQSTRPHLMEPCNHGEMQWNTMWDWTYR